MDSNLVVIYLSIFVGLLGFAGVSVFRQVFKTRKLESSLNKLKNKLTKEKGTAQEYYELASIYSEKKVFSQAIPLFQKSLKAAEEEGTAILLPESELTFPVLMTHVQTMIADPPVFGESPDARQTITRELQAYVEAA